MIYSYYDRKSFVPLKKTALKYYDLTNTSLDKGVFVGVFCGLVEVVLQACYVMGNMLYSVYFINIAYRSLILIPLIDFLQGTHFMK